MKRLYPDGHAWGRRGSRSCGGAGTGNNVHRKRVLDRLSGNLPEFLPFIARPAQLIRPALGGGNDVVPFVTVEVGDDDLVGVDPGLLHDVLDPLPARIARV